MLRSVVNILYYTVLLSVFTALYCTILYFTILYCIILDFTVLYCIILYYSVLYCIILYYTVLCPGLEAASSSAYVYVSLYYLYYYHYSFVFTSLHYLAWPSHRLQPQSDLRLPRAPPTRRASPALTSPSAPRRGP